MLDGVTKDTGLIVATTETLSPTLWKTEKIIGAYTIPIGWGLAGWDYINALGPNTAIRNRCMKSMGG